MRDFNNGGDMNIHGGLTINDHSQNDIGKPLASYTSEVLREERPFRQENLRLERNKKIKTATPFLVGAVILFIVAAVWAQINGKSDLVSFVLGVGSLVVTVAAIMNIVEPNPFEMQEENAIREINLILKSRRVE